MKQYKFAIIITVILFIIPFFWLKPGEMNLGGDSGRLYFYDPATYLNLRVLFNYLGSGNGVELTYYIYLPYTVFLLLFKLVFRSPTMLISFFNGLTLSVSFFSIYLILKELFKENKNTIKSAYIEFSSILAGLFYLLSQISIYSGWYKPIITFNQLFLNPLMTLLLLKFMLTQRMRYMFAAIITTFIFTPNFSIVGSPPFFAFYPITIIFLFLYAKFIRGVTFKWRFFIIGILLFLLIHAFHLVNTIGGIFSSGSSYNKAIFALEGEEGSRNALNYFISVAGNIKLSLIWMSLSQLQSEPYFAILIIVPLILVIAFFLNRGKTLLLTGLFFLIFFYFTSAITETGFFVYKQFFRIPGFSIFRNFHGQWLYVFFLFYALLLGQAIAIVANKLNKRNAFFLFAIFGVIIIGFGLPLLNGTVPIPTDKETGVRNHFRMDPAFEQALYYFRSKPIDGKVLIFPLTDPGYQIFQGLDGGVYKGLPLISYLGGKSEFGGYENLKPFQDIFLTSIQNNDYETLGRLLSVMNIRWMFYNSDPYIYSEPFQSYYSHVSKYMPKDQEGYKVLIKELPILTKLTDFSKNYHIYSVKDNIYFPHIFTTQDIKFTNEQSYLMFDSNFQKDMHQVVLPTQSVISKENNMILYGLPKTFLVGIQNNAHLHNPVPFIKWKLNDLVYPLIVIKEKYDLSRLQKQPVKYLDYSLFLLSKRIEEIMYFGDTIKTGQSSWQKPQIWEIDKWFSYNSWNASLVRYEMQADEIMNWNNNKIFDEEQVFNKVKISEQFYHHEMELLRKVYDYKDNTKKIYLLSAVNNMYKRLYEKINIPVIDPSLYSYWLPEFNKREGKYEIYLDGKNISDQNQLTVNLDGEILKPRFKDVMLDGESDTSLSFNIPVNNLVKDEKWSNSGTPMEKVDDITTLVLNNKLGELTSGLTLEIPNWTEKNVYLISFDYMTNGDDYIFSFVDKKDVDDPLKMVGHKLFFEKRLNSINFKTHQSIVFAEPKSTNAFLKIAPFFPKDKGTIQIKNLVVQKIHYPKAAFKKIVPQENKVLPNLTFTKINPTKYVLDIKGATDPYALVFLESFSKNWKLFNTEFNSGLLTAGFWRFLGRAGKVLTGLFIKDTVREKSIAASYFNNKVKEGVTSNIFLDSNTFETWGKNTFFDDTHSPADEYANAWYIIPSDMGGKTDYTLILELETQRKFYPAILISLLTIIFLLLYLIKKFLWSKKR